MLTILAFILTLGILVTVHEYGHFQVAKWCGVKVLKFSIGFGKPIWSKTVGQDQTEFIIAAIPLGGYVKMLGEDLSDSEEGSFGSQDMSRALNRQSVGKRMAIVLAGPFANLILAVILYWILFMMGVAGMKPIVGKVPENSPAAVASIGTGEMIQRINGKDVATWQDVRWILLNESLKKNNVEIQAINAKQEIHLYKMDLSNLDYDDDQDILEKLGLTAFRPDIPARIGEIAKNSPADLASLKVNDLILAVNDHKVSDWEGFVQEIRQYPGISLNVLVLREAKEMRFLVTPESVIENGKTVGRIGAASKMEQSELDKYFVTPHFSVAEAFAKSVEKTWDTAIFSLKMLGNMVLGNVSWKGMSGPVTIASYAGQSANMGIKVFIGFLALISISIGVLNLLPIPILDGGHFMYYMVELFTGRPVSETAIGIGQRLGFFILGCMMVLALYNDMNRLITG